MNKTALIVSVICLLLVGSVYVYNAVEENNAVVSDCDDFNGRDFLLTGGTGTPDNIEEVNYELSRLNWLCNGDS